MRCFDSGMLGQWTSAAEHLVATAHAAPLPRRLALGGVAGFAAAGVRLVLARAFEPGLPDTVDLLAVACTGLLGGFAPGALAAGGAALGRLWRAPGDEAGRMSDAVQFLAASAILLAAVEMLHRLRKRTEARAAPFPIALEGPGVIGVFYIDPNGHVAYRYISPKAKTVFGLEPAEICADAGSFFKRLDREDIDALNAGLLRSARELSVWDVEFRFDHPDKGIVWLEAQAEPVREAGGLMVWHGYAFDITSRKRAELSLAETAARLQATIDAAQDAVLTIDEAGRIATVNRVGAEMFGYRPDEFVSMHVGSLIGPGEETTEWALPDTGVRHFIARRRDGSAFPADMTLTQTPFEGKSLRIAFIKDLTEQRKIEGHLQQLYQDRFDAMGTMAAAMAHEINQPLAANATYLRVARRLLEKSPHAGDGAIIDVLDKAATQTLRAGRIVTNLKELVRLGEPNKTLLGVHSMIGDVHDAFLEESASSGVAFTIRARASRDQVVADRAQLKQVLSGLVRNALEAMQSAESRKLSIETTNPEEGVIRVDVIDSGCGLPESSDAGYFEPFTTTKTKGMGVGLSISRSIVEAHYGRIWATPNAGGGAVFSFTLPLQESDSEA